MILKIAVITVVVEDFPEELDWVEIRRLADPRQNGKSAIRFFSGEVILDDVGCVLGVVVLLEQKSTAQKTCPRWNSVVNENLFVFLFHENAFDLDECANATRSEAFPHHNTFVLFYGARDAIWVIALTHPSPDTDTPVPAKIIRTLIRPQNLFPLCDCPMNVSLCPTDTQATISLWNERFLAREARIVTVFIQAARDCAGADVDVELSFEVFGDCA